MKFKRIIALFMVCILCAAPLLQGVAEEMESGAVPQAETPPKIEVPQPETSPAPEPETDPTPEPETSPTPEPETNPTPEPETDPTSEPEITPEPTPELPAPPEAGNGILAEGYEALLVDVLLGETLITLGEGYAYFRFVPETTQVVRFETMGDAATSGYLFDNPNSDCLVFSEGGGQADNFAFQYKVEAGVEYILAIACDKEQAPANVTLSLQPFVLTSSVKHMDVSTTNSTVEVAVGLTHASEGGIYMTHPKTGKYIYIPSGTVLTVDKDKLLTLEMGWLWDCWLDKWEVKAKADSASIANADGETSTTLQFSSDKDCSVYAVTEYLPEVEARIASMTETSVTLSFEIDSSWSDDPAGLTFKKFYIYREETNIGAKRTYYPQQIGVTTSATYTDSNLKSNKTYYYSVEAEFARAGGGTFYSSFYELGDFTAGFPSIELTAYDAGGTNMVGLSWWFSNQAPLNDLDFILKVGTSKTNMKEFESFWGPLNPGDTWATYLAPKAGTTYYFSVTPKRGTVVGRPSNIVAFKPAVPKFTLSARPWGDKQVLLTFNYFSNSEYYELYCSENPYGPGVPIKGFNPNDEYEYEYDPDTDTETETLINNADKPNFVYTPTNPAKKATYWVVSTPPFAGGQSFRSNTVSFQPTAPKKPTLAFISRPDCTILLQWNTIGANGYRLERSTDGKNWTDLKTFDAPADFTVDETPALEYLDVSCVDKTTYSYRVIPIWNSIDGTPSAVVKAKPAWVRLKVTAKSSGYESVKLTWPVAKNATSYEVRYATKKNMSDAQTIPNITDPFYTVTGLTPLTTYYFDVCYTTPRLGAADATSPASAVVSAKPAWVKPVLKATLADYQTVALSWASVNDGTAEYKLEKKNGNKWDRLDTSALVVSNGIYTYPDTSLPSGSYSYRLTISSLGTTSPVSATVTAKTGKAALQLNIASTSYNSITLRANVLAGTTYIIERADKKNPKAADFAVLSGSFGADGTYVDNTVKNCITYSYRMKPDVSNWPVADYSAIKSAKAALAAPVIAVKAGYDGDIEISWPEVPNADGYIVYWSTNASKWFSQECSMLIDSNGAITYTEDSWSQSPASVNDGIVTYVSQGNDYIQKSYYKVAAIFKYGNVRVEDSISTVKSGVSKVIVPQGVTFARKLSTTSIQWTTPSGWISAVEIYCAYGNKTSYVKVGEIDSWYDSFTHYAVPTSTAVKYRVRFRVDYWNGKKFYSPFVDATNEDPSAIAPFGRVQNAPQRELPKGTKYVPFAGKPKSNP